MDGIPLIPHEPPMHWLDAASVSEDELHATAVCTIADAHPFVRDGHLLPSALVELMAQAAAAGSAIKAQRQGRAIRRGVLVSIRDLRFAGIGATGVPVGVTIHLEAIHERTLGPLSMGSLEARVEGVVIASGRMTFHLDFE